MINSRFIDFEFPFYREKQQELVDIPKNCYKIYATKHSVSFIEQVQFPLVDKRLLSEYYNTLINDYHCIVLWKDGNENILYCPNNKSPELIKLIYEFNDKIYPKKYGIENGFYTETSLKEEILNHLPIVHICFYE